MSISDMFRVDEIKATLQKVGKERNALKAKLIEVEKERDELKVELDKIKREYESFNKLLIDSSKERSSLKLSLENAESELGRFKLLLSDTDKMTYSQLKSSLIDLNARKEKARNELLQFDGWFTNRKRDANNLLLELDKQISLKKNEVLILDDKVLLQSFGFYQPHYDFENSEQYKLRLDQIRKEQEQTVRQGIAASYPKDWTLNGSASEGSKMIKDSVKLILRAFNNECDTSIANVKFNNIEATEKKIRKAFDTLNNLGSRMSISIVSNYLLLKLQELYLCHEYQLKKQDEKEEQKLVKEQMREEAKRLREIEEMKAKIEKEEKHFGNALENIVSKLEQTQTDSERALLEKEREVITQKISGLEKDKLDVKNQEQNTRAGYVYVISNIGAFGENIFKIGVTRRLDPVERVDELGDASVPFDFDVHAMIFSDDAPSLENAIHKTFEQKRINMINRRREFFNVSLDEIEKVVKTNFSKPVEFIKIPDAAEYRESLMLKQSAVVLQ